MEFRYFSSVKGAAVPRFGSTSFIGAARTPRGFAWNLDAVVAVPVEEVNRYLREYNRVLRSDALRERKVVDFEQWQAKQAAEDKATEAKAAAATEAKAEQPARPRRAAAGG